MLRARLLTFVALLGVVSLSASGTAFAADPLGLTLDNGAGEAFGLGTDTIAVWVCKVPGTADPKTFSPEEVAEWANDDIAPFFSLISRGRYAAVFEPAGSFTRSADCLDEAIDRTTDGRFTNVMVMDDTDKGGGLGGAGAWYLIDGEVQPVGPAVAPSVSGRGFSVGGGMFDLPATATHEIGHTLTWPHSGSSATSPTGQYDNPADLMSGQGIDNFCPVSPTMSRGPCEIVHTIAFNRYTSGWVDADEVELVTKPVAGMDLAGPESAGSQMALVPSADPLVFTTVEARPDVGYDAGAGIAGVMLHTVDQQVGCGPTPVCWGLNRRQFPALGPPGSTDHILGVGEQAVVHGVTISVVAATADGYTVTFSGTPQGCAMGPNPFTDVSTASFAYNDIGCIRLLGITKGTSASTYAPAATVTREQMAAFLARLHRESGGSCGGGSTPFVDIAGSFAAADIACIYDLGVTTGTSTSTYAPAATVTREQMAAFLARLYRESGGSCGGGSTPFVDIAGSFAAADIACIYDLGVTTGTTATTYAPADPVTREQMAAFLARFWKTL